MAEVIEEQKKPRGLYFRSGSWLINKEVKGVRIYKTLGTADLDVALLRYEVEIGRRAAIKAKSSWCEHVAALLADKQSWLHKTYGRLQTRGRCSGKGCTITLAEMYSMMLETEGKCQVTGIPFSDRVPEGARIAPFRASIDRIDSKQGYHYSNCRVVCLSVNLAMRDWGELVMLKIAKAMLWKHLRDEVEN